jgi:hypothetical protein
MTDKGFEIEEDCEDLLGVSLIRPPFLQKRTELTKSEAVENETIASARVHVERVIKRMKTYTILKHTRLPERKELNLSLTVRWYARTVT